MNNTILKNMSKKEIENYYDTFKGNKEELFYQIISNLDVSEFNKNFLKRMIIQNINSILSRGKDNEFKVDIYLKILSSFKDDDLINEFTNLILGNLRLVLGNSIYKSNIKDFIKGAVKLGYTPSKITESKFFDYVSLDLILNSKDPSKFLESSLPFIKEKISNLYLENSSQFSKLFLSTSTWKHYVAYIFLGSSKIYDILMPKKICDEFPSSLNTYIKEKGLTKITADLLELFLKKYPLYVKDIIEDDYTYLLKNGLLYHYILSSDYVKNKDENVINIQKFYRELPKDLKEDFALFVSKNSSKTGGIVEKYIRSLYDSFEFAKLSQIVDLNGLNKDEKSVVNFFVSLPVNGTNFFIEYYKKNYRKSVNIIKDFCLYAYKSNRLDIITYNITFTKRLDLPEEVKEILSLYSKLSYENKILFTNFINKKRKSTNLVKDFINELFLSAKLEELDRLDDYHSYFDSSQNSILIMYFRCSSNFKEEFKNFLESNNELSFKELENKLVKYAFDNGEFNAIAFKSRRELLDVLTEYEYDILTTTNYLLEDDKSAYANFCSWVKDNASKFTENNAKTLLSKYLFDIKKYDLLSYYQEYFVALPKLEHEIISLYKNLSPFVREVYISFLNNNIDTLTVENLNYKFINYLFDNLEFEALIWLITYRAELNVLENLSKDKLNMLEIYKQIDHKNHYLDLIKENHEEINTPKFEEKLIRFLFDNYEYKILCIPSFNFTLSEILSKDELLILKVYTLLSTSSKVSFIYLIKTADKKESIQKLLIDYIKLLFSKKMFQDVVALKEVCNYKQVLTKVEVEIIDLWVLLNEFKSYRINGNILNNFVSSLNYEDKTINIKKLFLEYLFNNRNYNDILNIKEVINYNEYLTKEEILVIEYYLNIEDEQTREAFKSYMSKYKSADFVNRNVQVIFELFDKIYHTNSDYLLGIQDTLLDKLKESSDPIKDFTLIEEIFTKNTLPDFIKIYLCFKTIYSDLSDNNVFNFDNRSKLSPVLKNKFLLHEFLSPSGNISIKKYFYYHSSLKHSDVDTLTRDNPKKLTKELDKVRLAIIYNDLFRIAIDSNNRSLTHYMNLIEKGNSLYIGLLSNSYELESLTQPVKELLNEFCQCLETIYTYAYDKKLDIENKSLEEKLECLYDIFIPTKKYDIPDRIVRILFGTLGIKSFMELKNYIHERRNVNSIRRIIRSKEEFKLEDGDLIRGIGTLKDIPTILDQGNVSKEYLSTINGTTDSDNTPLDIDFSRISKNEYQENKQQELYDLIEGTATNTNYGNIYVVIKKDNPNIYITKNSLDEKAEYHLDRLELFIQPFGPNQYCIRTGMGFSLVDYLLVQTYDEIEISALKMELVKNKTYIPIVNIDGKLIFPLKEYEELSKKVSGLKYYGYEEFIFDGLQNFNTFIYDLNSLDSDDEKRCIIISELKQKLNRFVREELNIPVVNDYITGDIGLNSAEIISVGSSDRNTSIPGDNLYKFELRIDRTLLKNIPDLLKKLKEYFKPSKSVLKGNNISGEGIKLDCLNELVNLDIQITQKRKLTALNTNDALKEKLNSIKNTSTEMYDLVRQNIIEAKLLFKSKSINLSDEFIENWILQNGGSLYSACKTFYEAAIDQNTGDPVDLFVFQTKYPLWDLGQSYDILKKYQYKDYTNEEFYEEYYLIIDVVYDYVTNYENQFLSSKVNSFKKEISK